MQMVRQIREPDKRFALLPEWVSAYPGNSRLGLPHDIPLISPRRSKIARLIYAIHSET